MAREKWEDGERRPLTPEEEAARDAEEDAFLSQAAEEKMAEADEYRQYIMTLNAETNLRVNWVIVTSAGQRLYFNALNGFLLSRLAQGNTPYYPSPVTVFAINTSNGRFEEDTVSETEWNQIQKDVAQHDAFTISAWEAVRAEVAAATTSSEINAIDVTDARFSWPPVYEGPVRYDDPKIPVRSAAVGGAGGGRGRGGGRR